MGVLGRLEGGDDAGILPLHVAADIFHEGPDLVETVLSISFDLGDDSHDVVRHRDAPLTGLRLAWGSADADVTI
jgi:hypothetical protein